MVGSSQGHYGLEVSARGIERQSAQTVVGTKLNDDDTWRMRGQRVRQARQTAGSCLAADAGIHDLESVPFTLHAVRQQTYPALIDRNAVTGAEAVAVYQDQRLLARRARGRHRRPREQQAKQDDDGT